MKHQTLLGLVFAVFLLAFLLWPKPAASETLTVPQMVIKEFGAPSIMVRIAMAESTFDPTAKNPYSTASGVYQILNGTWNDYDCAGDVFDPTDNITCARKIYDKEGTTPWNASIEVWGKNRLPN